MPVLAYIHQLFNAEHCQTYIHTLRWKDRPLQCPRCQSQDVDPWGTYHYRPGCKRSWCNGCQRTFNDLTDTCSTRAGGRSHTGFWPPSCCACRVRRGALPGSWGSIAGPAIAGAGGCARPAVSYETDRQLAGTVEADDLYHTAGQKGQAQGGGKKDLREGNCDIRQ